MIKVTLLLGAILVLATAAVLKTTEEKANIVNGCKFEQELWGSVDGTKFYFCIGNNQSIEQPCPTDTFFVKNSTVSGCIPQSEVEDNCIYHLKPQPCEGIHVTQPQPHLDPTKFYFCPKTAVDPVVLNCPQGAFVSQDGYLGCFNWTMWRTIRGCNSTE